MEALRLLGLTTIDVMPVSTTVTVVDPEHAEQLPEAAVIVASPTATPVTTPEVCPTDTLFESLEDHVTPEVSVFWLPSLNVPVALICQVWLTLIFSPWGPTETPVRVGLTKNPRQLIARANAASAAQAPITRTLCLMEDMVVGTPRARPLQVLSLIFPNAKIVAEKISPGAHSGNGIAAWNQPCQSQDTVCHAVRTPVRIRLAQKVAPPQVRLAPHPCRVACGKDG
jgi:hypothetical protein